MKQKSKTRELIIGLLKSNWILLAGIFILIVLSASLSSITPMIFQKVIDDLTVLKLPALLLYVLAIVAIPFAVTLLDVGKTKFPSHSRTTWESSCERTYMSICLT